MSYHPETNVRASTVDEIDENSAKSPSDTGCRFCNEVGEREGTGMCFLCDFDFESCDALPDEEYRTYHGSKCDGEQGPSAVSKIPDSRMTHIAFAEESRNSKSRPAQGRDEQLGVTQRKVQAESTNLFKTRAFTRSQGQVPSEEDGASTAGGNTAVKIKDDVGQISIKEEES